MEKPPSRINGKTNPAYQRWWSKTKKGKECLKVSRQRYEKSEKGKATKKRAYNSEAGVAWRKDFTDSKKARNSRLRREGADGYADRIMSDLKNFGTTLGPEEVEEPEDMY